MKVFFLSSSKWIGHIFTWAFHHDTHSESWRKSGIFFLTIGAITFMQLTLVIMPMEKEGNFNLYEAERIEQIDIKNALEHVCTLEGKAYTQCSMAKYHLKNVNVLLPIFTTVSVGALSLGIILLFLYVLSYLEKKPSEFASWIAGQAQSTSESPSPNENTENKNDVQKQASHDC